MASFGSRGIRHRDVGQTRMAPSQLDQSADNYHRALGRRDGPDSNRCARRRHFVQRTTRHVPFSGNAACIGSVDSRTLLGVAIETAERLGARESNERSYVRKRTFQAVARRQ